MSFWSFMQNGQWSVETVVTSPVRMYFHSSSWCPSARARSGVEQTHFAPSKPGRAELLLEGQVQVLRAGLAEHVLPVARLGDPGQRLLGRHVHDVERRAGQVGEHDRAVRGLLLGLPGRVMPWKYGAVSPRASACCTRTSIAEPFSACIMISPPLPAAVCMACTICPSVGQEHAGVGHEQLEAGDALGDQLVHRLERLVVDLADDLVEAVVDRAVAAGLLVPSATWSCTRWPCACTTKSTIVVVPPQAAARVPVSKVSEARVPPNGISMCVCASMPPGITYLPVASMTCRRSPSRSAPSTVEPGASSAAIVSPWTRTS